MASFKWDNLMWPEIHTDILDGAPTPLTNAHFEFQKQFLGKVASKDKYVDGEGIPARVA
jgi:hypothetical protein